jgi:hypothetical protein
MRLEITGPRFGSLNGKFQCFVRRRPGKFQTHRRFFLYARANEEGLSKKELADFFGPLDVGAALSSASCPAAAAGHASGHAIPIARGGGSCG